MNSKKQVAVEYPKYLIAQNILDNEGSPEWCNSGCVKKECKTLKKLLIRKACKSKAFAKVSAKTFGSVPMFKKIYWNTPIEPDPQYIFLNFFLIIFIPTYTHVILFTTIVWLMGTINAVPIKIVNFNSKKAHGFDGISVSMLNL